MDVLFVCPVLFLPFVGFLVYLSLFLYFIITTISSLHLDPALRSFWVHLCDRFPVSGYWKASTGTSICISPSGISSPWLKQILCRKQQAKIIRHTLPGSYSSFPPDVSTATFPVWHFTSDQAQTWAVLKCASSDVGRVYYEGEKPWL